MQKYLQLPRALLFAAVFLACMGKTTSTFRISTENPHLFTLSAYGVSDLLSDQDFDVRDENNNPVSNQTAQQELRGLFVTSLYQLLLVEDIPAIKRTMERLEQLSGLMRGMIRALTDSFKHAVPYGVPVSFRKFLEQMPSAFLAWLCALAVFGLVPTASLVLVPYRKKPPLVLRC